MIGSGEHPPPPLTLRPRSFAVQLRQSKGRRVHSVNAPIRFCVEELLKLVRLQVLEGGRRADLQEPEPGVLLRRTPLGLLLLGHRKPFVQRLI